MKIIQSFWGWCLALCILTSCNIWAPLAANSSDEDHLEEAQSCLHSGDYTCAISNYEALSNADLKKQKLCSAHLARAGFTISALINTVTKQSDKVLGDLAKQVAPWDAAKGASADSAFDYCAQYKALSSSGELGVLLRTLSAFLLCANRISKADLIQSVDDSSDACATAGAGNGVTAADVAASSDGTISSSSPGMCKKDVEACRDAISTLSSGELSGSSLGDIGSALDSVPAEIKNSSAAAAVVRNALKGVVE